MVFEQCIKLGLQVENQKHHSRWMGEGRGYNSQVTSNDKKKLITQWRSSQVRILKFWNTKSCMISFKQKNMRWTPTFNEECLNCLVYRHRSFQPPRQHVLGEFQLRDGPRSQRPTGWPIYPLWHHHNYRWFSIFFVIWGYARNKRLHQNNHCFPVLVL